MTRTLYGIGTGPGASDLLTIRAVNILNDADFIFAPNNRGKNMALDTAQPYLGSKEPVLLDFPMGKSNEETYRDAMETIDRCLKPGMKGAFLNIGDSTIYSTFMNMVNVYHPDDMNIELVPGIPSFVAAANVIQQNITLKGETFLLCDDPEKIVFDGVDTVALLKTSGNLEDTLARLEDNGFVYFYVSRASFPEEKVLTNREDILKEKNYMSLILARRDPL